MKAQQIRRTFLDFFVDHGHREIASAPLVPENDPTLFFVNAGMVPFKDVFTGRQPAPHPRAATVQRCLRVSGKHNDLEAVGHSPRHHTLFEMLGNFSFGDYFKTDAIAMAWELLTGPLGIDPARLWVTVFEDDDEAMDLWRGIDGPSVDRIQRLGAKDNFWSMGETGPCGPCSEIFFDHGPAYGPAGGPATESDRYVEIWNLVFMQFERGADGTMTPLPRPSIDTGSGLERLAAALQGVFWNYDTDCFRPIMDTVARVADVRRGGSGDVALRAISDHARATAFLIADGIMPSNEARGYVLRRLMRRAIRFGSTLGIEGPFFSQATGAVVDHMCDAYPLLKERERFIREVVLGEEERFSRTLRHGLHLLDEHVSGLTSGAAIAGDVAFKLYDTYGFPLDLTRQIAGERGVTVDEAGYDAAMEAQRARGRAAWRGSGDKTGDAAATGHAASTFTGYTADRGTGTVQHLHREGVAVSALSAGEQGTLIVERSPFYAESGGQVGDSGQIRAAAGVAQVTDTRKDASGAIVHSVTLTEGSLSVGEVLELEVDHARRDRIRLNHTATHLLHAALRDVLGTHVTQKGSLVDPARLRFDFSHHLAVTTDELITIEDRVYELVLANLSVDTSVCSLDDARERGAMALFGEKYGAEVRVVEVPGASIELCGGTHARRTGDIGLFRVVSESGIAAGVRRIEAVTGRAALERVRARSAVVRAAAQSLRSPPDGIPEAIERVLKERKRLEKELAEVRVELARLCAGDLTDQARTLPGGARVLAAEFEGSPQALREEAERLRDQLGTAVVVLGARAKGRVQLVATVSRDLLGTAHAGKLIGRVAKLVGGGGGGRPDMAQAGGRNPDALPAALEAAHEMIAAQMGGGA